MAHDLHPIPGGPRGASDPGGDASGSKMEPKLAETSPDQTRKRRTEKHNQESVPVAIPALGRLGPARLQMVTQRGASGMQSGGARRSEKKEVRPKSLRLVREPSWPDGPTKVKKNHLVFLLFGGKVASRVGHLILYRFGLRLGPCLVTCDFQSQKNIAFP